MKRANGAKRARAMYEGFDRAYIDAPRYPGIKYFVSKSLKTIFINISAADDGLTMKIREGEEDLYDFDYM